MNIREQAMGVMQELGFETGDLKDEASLEQDLGIDSTELAEIITALEKCFSIRIDSDAEDRFASFGDLIACVGALLSAPSH